MEDLDPRIEKIVGLSAIKNLIDGARRMATGLFKEKVFNGQILTLIIELMKSVETISGLPGRDRKVLVIFVLKSAVMDVDSGIWDALDPIMLTSIPHIVDAMCTVANGGIGTSISRKVGAILSRVCCGK